MRCILGVWSVGWEWLGDKETRAWPMGGGKEGKREGGAFTLETGLSFAGELSTSLRTPSSQRLQTLLFPRPTAEAASLAGLGWAGWGCSSCHLDPAPNPMQHPSPT